MGKRQETSTARRRARHLKLIAAEFTELGRLWKVCNYLAAEASRADRVREVTSAVFGLVEWVRENQSLPDALHQLATAIDPHAVYEPWYPHNDTHNSGPRPAGLPNTARRDRAA